MSSLIVLTGLFLGLPVVALLVFYNKRNSRNNIFLALSLFSIWYALFGNNLNFTGAVLRYPYLFRTANIGGYLILPFLYFYVRNTFYPGIYWRKRDWIFFLPVIFYCVDLMPFFLSNNNHKVEIIKAILNNPSNFFSINEGWIATNKFHYVFRYLFALFMMGLLVRLIIRNWNFEPKNYGSANRPLFWFIVILTALYVPLLVPGIFGVLFNLKWYTLNFLNVSLSISLLFAAVYILFSPPILYGFLPAAVVQEAVMNETKVKSPPIEIVKFDTSGHTEITTKSNLNQNELQGIIEKIQHFMEEKKPFLQHGYTIHHLSEDIGIPVYQLSPVINHQFQSNFSSWINKFRIDYFIGLCSKADKRGFTFDALSAESGFSNRATFIKAFKKEKGTTPGIFLKEAFNDDDTVVHL